MSALFELPPGARVEHEPKPVLTAGEALRARQQARLDVGLHPLSMPGRHTIRLHADAAPAADKSAHGLRCGGCRFRELLLSEGGRAFPKCMWRGGSRASHSTASDVRSWWPACRDFEPKPRGG
ncbi:MAG: hypothetical protein ACRDVE_04420 [Actinocrinis sp.]